jgi:hypothetical protein
VGFAKVALQCNFQIDMITAGDEYDVGFSSCTICTRRNNEKLQIGTSEVRLAIPDPSVQNEQNKSGEVSCGDSKALRA